MIFSVCIELVNMLDCVSESIGEFVRWELSDCTTAVLWDAASRNCSKLCIILVYFLSSLFFQHFVKVQAVPPYNSTDIAKALKNSDFILSEKLKLQMVDNLSISVCVFTMHMVTLLSVDEILLPRYVNGLLTSKVRNLVWK